LPQRHRMNSHGSTSRSGEIEMPHHSIASPSARTDGGGLDDAGLEAAIAEQTLIRTAPARYCRTPVSERSVPCA
jgi:hypothetical protein